MNARADRLTKLYEAIGPQVWRFALRQTCDPQEANDVLQETFYVAMKDFERVLSARSQRAWLLGIAANIVRQRRRGKRTEPLIEEPFAPPSAGEDLRKLAMHEAIRRLDAPMQEVLRLRLSDELSYAEIAEVLDIPIGTVRSRLHAAVGRLRQWATSYAAAETAHSTPRCIAREVTQ